MILLRVDGVDIPLPQEGIELPSYDVKQLRSCGAQREGGSVVLRVKATERVEQLLGFAEQATPSSHFNDSYHYGEVVIDGVMLFSGVVSYCSTEYIDGVRYYNLRILSGGATWADIAATTKLKEVPIEASRLVELSSIYESWSDDNPIKMLPVTRDSYPETERSGLYEIYHPKLPQEYHPFISVRR